jgi:hypothetical protein
MTELTKPRRAWDVFAEIEDAVSYASRFGCALAMASYGVGQCAVEEEHEQRALQALAVEVMHAARKAHDLWHEAHGLFVAERGALI